jgi:ABC-type nitrate/sulfonate/bicarbonate transport system substrate-binding protein
MISLRQRAATIMVVLVALVSLAVGCGGEPSTTTDGQVRLTAIAGSSVDFIALVPLAAWDILEGEGIIVEQRFVEEAPTAIQAIEQGQAQIGTNIGVNVGVPAVEEGARIVDVVATQRPTWALAVAPDINSFADLQGKRIAVHGEASFTRAVSQWFARENGFQYEELIIPGSEVRAEALAQGQIDASVIDLPDVVQLSHTYPGSFKVLTTIGEEFPELIEQDLWLSRTWAEKNPKLAARVVKAIVEAMRKLTSDTDYALELGKEHLPDMDETVLSDLVKEYSSRGLWPADGLLNEKRALDTLTFFDEVGEIDIGTPTQQTLSKYFDFSYLKQAIAELGG